MSLCKYFKPVSTLATLEKAGLSTLATAEANKAVERVLQCAETTTLTAGMKRKYTLIFTSEVRKKIAKYAAENGNTRVSKKYCVAESTVRLFKSKYLAALKSDTEAGIEEEVRAIPAGKRGRPLLLGELEKDVQK